MDWPVSGRAAALGIAARVLALLGAMGHTALATMYLVWAELPSSDAARGQMVGAIDRVIDGSSLAILAPLIIAFPLAVVVFYLATVRARITPRWLLVPVIAAPVLAGASETVALVVLIGVTCVLAALLLREPGEAAAPVSATAPA